MSKVVRFIRERTPFILIVYGAYIYFRSYSSRAASDILSFIICRSHTSILSWFRSLCFLFPDKCIRRNARVLLVDDTRIKIGSRERVLYIAFKPYLRRIVCMMTFDVANILTSIIFIKRVKAICGSNIIILTDGAPYYRASCRILNLRHGVYSLEVRNLMERIIEYVKDRTRLFDNYIPCIKDECDGEHAEMLLKSIMIMLNETWINRRVKAKEFIENTIPIIEVMKHA
jgi:transposase-like protein